MDKYTRKGMRLWVVYAKEKKKYVHLKSDRPLLFRRKKDALDLAKKIKGYEGFGFSFEVRKCSLVIEDGST